ncbi:MAG: zinc-ribbon domain-containing protein [Methanoregula sp.]|nr:zinc-ribbon domain-containing protein [Methanoregula sp.]
MPARPPSDDDEVGEEEDEGGLSPYLQPGEQVIIGSLNVSVKKFFFHAYMTDRRIFLIDTQEKKLKVTAKDVPRNTLAGSIVEFSENSDPVLVLSIRSPDDEIKTMKIVFVQNGMDRSSEIDEWIALLHEKDEQPARPSRPVAEETAEPEPEKAPALPKTAVKNQELRPARKPVKDLEKQPPVKRLISFTKVPEEKPLPEAQPVSPPRRAQVRQVTESAKKAPVVAESEREASPAPREVAPAVKKPEVQSAMKVAMKSAMKPLAQPPVRPPKRSISEHAPPRRPVVEPEVREMEEPPRREKAPEKAREPPLHEEPAEVPQFCHNCGKKLPLEANFCPGCGTRLGQNRTLPNTRFPQPSREKRALPADTVIPERKQAPQLRTEAPDEDEIEDEKPQPTKPPVKKAPKGSEMTILHKFLRR